MSTTNRRNEEHDAENTLSTDSEKMLPSTEGYSETVKGYARDILNRKDFKYDINADALYKQYADRFVKQGKMAMKDTMGQAAAMTGGYGNSYAQSVGQQAYNSHLEGLNDMIPELYQLALSKYTSEGENLRDKLSTAMAIEDAEYGRLQDAIKNEIDYNQAGVNVTVGEDGKPVVEEKNEYNYFDERRFGKFNLTDEQKLEIDLAMEDYIASGDKKDLDKITALAQRYIPSSEGALVPDYAYRLRNSMASSGVSGMTNAEAASYTKTVGGYIGEGNYSSAAEYIRTAVQNGSTTKEEAMRYIDSAVYNSVKDLELDGFKTNRVGMSEPTQPRLEAYSNALEYFVQAGIISTDEALDLIDARFNK